MPANPEEVQRLKTALLPLMQMEEADWEEWFNRTDPIFADMSPRQLVEAGNTSALWLFVYRLEEVIKRLNGEVDILGYNIPLSEERYTEEVTLLRWFLTKLCSPLGLDSDEKAWGKWLSSPREIFGNRAPEELIRNGQAIVLWRVLGDIIHASQGK